MVSPIDQIESVPSCLQRDPLMYRHSFIAGLCSLSINDLPQPDDLLNGMAIMHLFESLRCRSCAAAHKADVMVRFKGLSRRTLKPDGYCFMRDEASYSPQTSFLSHPAVILLLMHRQHSIVPQERLRLP